MNEREFAEALGELLVEGYVDIDAVGEEPRFRPTTRAIEATGVARQRGKPSRFRITRSRTGTTYTLTDTRTGYRRHFLTIAAAHDAARRLLLGAP